MCVFHKYNSLQVRLSWHNFILPICKNQYLLNNLLTFKTHYYVTLGSNISCDCISCSTFWIHRHSSRSCKHCQNSLHRFFSFVSFSYYRRYPAGKKEIRLFFNFKSPANAGLLFFINTVGKKPVQLILLLLINNNAFHSFFKRRFFNAVKP